MFSSLLYLPAQSEPLKKQLTTRSVFTKERGKNALLLKVVCKVRLSEYMGSAREK